MYHENPLNTSVEFKIDSYSQLLLPVRPSKPRNYGLTIAMDVGLGHQLFNDIIQSHHQLIDFIKFGWGTCLVTKDIERKIAILKEYNISFFFGGTLFETFAAQNKIIEFSALCKKRGCQYIEISNGTIDMSNQKKDTYIRQLSDDFIIFSEVGYKDSDRSLHMNPALWIEYINMDIEAGAYKVITEAREGANSGICRPDGEIRYGLIEEILSSDINPDQLIFEAPNKKLQTYFIEKVGCNANLANIDMQDIVSLETIRLGLRSDSLLFTEVLRHA